MLRIGDFARLGRVTLKALRLYDRAGLLRPARVDRWTGYRFYQSNSWIGLAGSRLSRISASACGR